MKNKLLLLTLFSAIALLLSPISYVTASNIQSESITDTTKLKNTKNKKQKKHRNKMPSKKGTTITAARFKKNGNERDFQAWVSANVKYPKEALKDMIDGRVVVQILIDTNGVVKEAILLSGHNDVLNNAVIEAVMKSPKWYSPAIKDGVPVSVRLNFGIVFDLEPSYKTTAPK